MYLMIRKKKKNCQEQVGGENKVLITLSRQKTTDIMTCECLSFSNSENKQQILCSSEDNIKIFTPVPISY